MKLNTPLPQSLQKECSKAAKIFKSFVDSGNNGLDGMIPRAVLQNAKGFAIYSVFKAGFLFSARAGSGIVIAKLGDGTWSAPSAIGTAGLGVGGQLGAEITDVLIVLNSQSAIASFMSAGSLTLGGNASVAIGPLGRNGEASGALSTKGKVAAMYSYSKTRGLFGGLSVEGSVIVERQDANALAYKSDVSARQLLSGHIDVPPWAESLCKTLDLCTGLPGGRKWIEGNSGEAGYSFSGLGTPREESPPSFLRKKSRDRSFSLSSKSWGSKGKATDSYFEPQDGDDSREVDVWDSPNRTSPTATSSSPQTEQFKGFDTIFESDFGTNQDSMSSHRPQSKSMSLAPNKNPTFFGQSTTGNTHSRSFSTPIAQNGLIGYRSPPAASDPFSGPTSSSLIDFDSDDNFYDTQRYDAQRAGSNSSGATSPRFNPPAPFQASEGVGKALALYNFEAKQPGDLSFNKGDFITITQRSESTDAWWTGKLNGSTGIFPANFVEVV